MHLTDMLLKERSLYCSLTLTSIKADTEVSGMNAVL